MCSPFVLDDGSQFQSTISLQGYVIDGYWTDTINMRIIFEAFLMWCVGFFTAPLIAGRAFFFHAAACSASKEAIDIFIDSLHPFTKWVIGSYLKEKFSPSTIYNSISLVVTSSLPFIVIFIFLDGVLESNNLFEIINGFFWIILSILVLIRLWFFGYKLRKIQASLDEESKQG